MRRSRRWLANGCIRQVRAFGDLVVYGDNPHRRVPGEPKHADWHDEDDDGHNGADPLLVDEFLRFVRDGGTPREVEGLAPELVTYFESGQDPSARW